MEDSRNKSIIIFKSVRVLCSAPKILTLIRKTNFLNKAHAINFCQVGRCILDLERSCSIMVKLYCSFVSADLGDSTLRGVVVVRKYHAKLREFFGCLFAFFYYCGMLLGVLLL